MSPYRVRARSAHDRDAVVFAVAGCAVVVGAIAGSAIVLTVLLTVAVVIAAVTLPHDGLTVALAAGLFWTNTVVVVGETLGTPPLLALLPQVLLLGLVMGRLIGGERELTVTPTFQVLLVYGAVQLFSSLTSVDGYTQIEILMAFVPEAFLLWLLVLNTVDGTVVLDRVMLAMTVGGGVMGAVVLAQYLTARYGADFVGFARLDLSETDLLAVDDDYLPRQSGSIGEKNRFAQVLVTTLPMALVTLRGAGVRRAAVAGTSLGLILVGIALSGSRGALFGVVVVAAVAVSGGILRLRHVGYAAATVSLALLVVPSYWERVTSTFEVVSGAGDPSSADSSTQGRLTENLAAIDMFVDHPLLGVGPGGYPPRYEEYAEFVGFNVRDGVRQPHNLYLHIGAEMGIVGLLALVGMFGLVLYRLRVARSSAGPSMHDRLVGMSAAIVAYAVTGVFLHLSYERFFWFLLALADATATIGLRERHQSGTSAERVDTRPDVLT